METESITFPDERIWDDLTESALFRAIVNGKRITCRISMEALSDHFRANLRADDFSNAMIATVVANRRKIEEMTRQKIQRNKFEADGTILIRSRDFN